MNAILLCAGDGKRLLFTKFQPKPLVNISYKKNIN